MSVETFITKVRLHPVLLRNKWQPSVVVHYLSNGVKIVTLCINTGGRYPREVFSVSRDHNDDLQVALDSALEYSNKMLDTIREESQRKERIHG